MSNNCLPINYYVMGLIQPFLVSWVIRLSQLSIFTSTYSVARRKSLTLACLTRTREG